MKFIQMQKSYKMKILQINKYFFKKGGAETVFFNTIQLLERHGHTVIPFSLKNKKTNLLLMSRICRLSRTIGIFFTQENKKFTGFYL